MEFLVRFLKEENHIIAATAQPSQLDFTTGMIQVGHTFEHEPNRVAEQKIRCFEFLVLVNLASLLLGHLGVDSNENILHDLIKR